MSKALQHSPLFTYAPPTLRLVPSDSARFGDVFLLSIEVQLGSYYPGQLVTGVVTARIIPGVVMGVAFGDRIRLGLVYPLAAGQACVDAPRGVEAFWLNEVSLLELWRSS